MDHFFNLLESKLNKKKIINIILKIYISSCNYKLSGTSSWSVNVHTEGCQNYNTCSKTLLMSFGSVKISAKGGEIIVDEKILDNEQNYIKDGRFFLIFFLI